MGYKILFKPRLNCLVWMTQQNEYEPDFIWYADFKKLKFADGPHYEQFGQKKGEFNCYRQGWGIAADGRYVFTEMHPERRSFELVAKNFGDALEPYAVPSRNTVLDMASKPELSKPAKSTTSVGPNESVAKGGKRNR